MEEMLAGDGVEPGAGFVEDEELGLGHQCAADEYSLAFALGEEKPWAVGEGGALNAL